ncbi:MAG TPA: hypothetical protein DEQ20_11825 [Desulfobulbaceae bacterium]|nr:MAG: hypothetical protein A2520_00450 [Deltaproteobacteria bacterium RIFOXYD12_FULL_53_23]HCC55585.1 hypothetical protein [Desulfobulbaceae bacterium]
MLAQCPHCQQNLLLSESQLEKLKTALASLSAGKTLRMGCPKCGQPIVLNADGSVANQAELGSAIAALKKPQPVRQPPPAPVPPALDWLVSGAYSEKEVVENVPHALIMIADQEITARVTTAFGEMGYQPTYARSAEEAIEKMQFVNFEAVALHSRFEGGDLASSTVHQYLREMAMTRRRYIFYILIGSEFHTFYDLEALANSANLVVNDSDANHFSLILKRGLNDYQDLFGPYLKALGNYGVK